MTTAPEPAASKSSLIALAVALAVCFAASLIGTRLTPRPRLAVRIGAGLVIAFAIVGPLLEHRYAGASGMGVIALGALLIAGGGLAFERVGSTGDRIGILLSIIAMSVTSVAAGLSGSVMLAQLGGAFTAALGGAWLLTLRRTRGWLAEGGLLVASALVGLVGLALLYSSMGLGTAIPILAIPFACGALSHWLPSKRAAIALAALVLGLSALAIIPLIGSSDEDASTDDYGYGY